MIQANFSIETRDLFRANLDLAKFRLLLGLGFSLSLVCGLVILFVIIDEKLILLQTSPLFVALPLFAVGGQILRLHASCRKYVSSLAESQRRIQYLFLADNDGYDVASGDSFGHVSWNDVLKIVEKQNCFYIFLSRFDIRVLPKRGFSAKGEVESLRSLLSSRLGTRAKLLDPTSV